MNAAQLYTTISIRSYTRYSAQTAGSMVLRHSILTSHCLVPGLSPSNESRNIAYTMYILTFSILVYHVFDSLDVIPITCAQLCVIPSCSRLRASLIYLVVPIPTPCTIYFGHASPAVYWIYEGSELKDTAAASGCMEGGWSRQSKFNSVNPVDLFGTIGYPMDSRRIYSGSPCMIWPTYKCAVLILRRSSPPRSSVPTPTAAPSSLPSQCLDPSSRTHCSAAMQLVPLQCSCRSPYSNTVTYQGALHRLSVDVHGY